MASDNDEPSRTTNRAPALEPDDFYLDSSGLMVFTERYHLKRGSCCASGCRHCPYGNSLVKNDRR